jgi:hypothetical protein
MKSDIEELKSRLATLRERLVPQMGMVSYVRQFESRVVQLERVITQLEREVAPLIENEPAKPKRRGRPKSGG